MGIFIKCLNRKVYLFSYFSNNTWFVSRKFSLQNSILLRICILPCMDPDSTSLHAVHLPCINVFFKQFDKASILNFVFAYIQGGGWQKKKPMSRLITFLSFGFLFPQLYSFIHLVYKYKVVLWKILSEQCYGHYHFCSILLKINRLRKTGFQYKLLVRLLNP